jgi:ABC-type branched-subunit amino acid transport system substrate-binding protein
MDIYCTHPHCEYPLNSFADLNNSNLLKTAHQHHCANCGTLLILDGRYLPSKLLKKGEFSTTFLGRDLQAPKLKYCSIEQLELGSNLSQSQVVTATKLFHQEAEALEKLGKHPNIPDIFACLELVDTAKIDQSQQQLFYIIREYIEGQNLHSKLLTKGNFTESAVIVILREVARILEFIHFQGAIHRNLQPSNIICDLQGKIYLINFGTMQQLVADSTDACTAPYAAWEQVQGQAYPSSDLYALAVTCLYLLTGKQPQDLLDHQTNKWVWRTPNLQVSDALAAILDRMLQFEPTARFQSARDILDRLDAAFGVPTLSIASTAKPDFTAPTPSTLFSVTLDPEPTEFDDYPPQIDELQSWNTSIVHPLPIATLDCQPVKFDSTAAAIVDTRRPAKAKKPLIFTGVLVTGLISLIAIVITKIVPDANLNLANKDPILKQSSSGERILISFEGNRDTDKFKQLKKAGVLAIANQNYAEAVTKLQAALVENPNSPETRIYLNNALIGNNKSYTIATSVPIGRSVDRASEMLRGFAQAQTELNQAGDVNEAKIKLKIIDDSDDPKVIETVAKAIANQPEVLGVVGHSRNDVTMKAADIYNRNKLAFVAPISTANQLTATSKPYIFRTNAKGDAIAEKLVERLIERDNKRKVAIFYVPGVATSNEFKTQFTNKLIAKGGKLVGAFPFSPVAATTSVATIAKPTFDADLSIRMAKKMGAEAILLLPVGRSNREALQVLKIRASDYPELTVLGDTALYNLNTLKAGTKAQGLIISVPWQESESTPQFSAGAKQLWRTQVNWATATSYNSIKAIGTAIKTQDKPSRMGVMMALSKNEFMGAAGRFKFTNGESTGRYSLVEVAPTPPNYKYSSSTGYDFIPIEDWLF